MANDSIPQMTGWEKRDVVENTLKTGDATTANNVLNTVQDQRLFMDLLASKADGDSLPGLHITSDKDGHAHEIRTDKMTVSDLGGHLSAQANNKTWGQYFQAKWDSVTNFGSAAAEATRDAVRGTELGAALANAGTSKSLTNQRIDAQVARAMGNN
jgi:hypothetical protein